MPHKRLVWLDDRRSATMFCRCLSLLTLPEREWSFDVIVFLQRRCVTLVMRFALCFCEWTCTLTTCFLVLVPSRHSCILYERKRRRSFFFLLHSLDHHTLLLQYYEINIFHASLCLQRRARHAHYRYCTVQYASIGTATPEGERTSTTSERESE